MAATREKIPLVIFSDVMHKAGRCTRDHRLLMHSDVKWDVVSAGLSVKGKTVLDVGCHVGHAVLHAAKWGAKKTLGLDIDKGVLACARRVRDALSMNNGLVGFNTGDLESVRSSGVTTDIVLCLGVLHKFDLPAYEEALKTLSSATKERLFIEMMVDKGDKPTVRTKGERGKWAFSTIPTEAWLESACRRAGLILHRRQPNPVYPYRQIWELRPAKS